MYPNAGAFRIDCSMSICVCSLTTTRGCVACTVQLSSIRILSSRRVHSVGKSEEKDLAFVKRIVNLVKSTSGLSIVNY